MVVLSAIAVALVASLFVLPVRGRGLSGGVADFTVNTISGKYERDRVEKARLRRKAEYQERVWKHNHMHWRKKHDDFRG